MMRPCISISLSHFPLTVEWHRVEDQVIHLLCVVFTELAVHRVQLVAMWVVGVGLFVPALLKLAE